MPSSHEPGTQQLQLTLVGQYSRMFDDGNEGNKF